MNLSCIRHFSNFAKTTLVNQCQYKDKGRLLLFNNLKIHVTSRSKVSKPILNEFRRKDKKSITLYGYFLLGIPVATFFLGTWQWQRLQWKLQLIKDLKAQLDMEPVNLLENIEQLDTMEYRLVNIKGSFLHENEFLLGPRSLTIHKVSMDSGNLFSRRMTNGWNVITPFQVEDKNLTILVNRGWIPEKAKHLPRNKIEGPIEITGVVRKEEQRPSFYPGNNSDLGIWYYRDINGMANMLGTSPIYIDLWSKTDPSEGPISCQTNVTLRNEHFSYMMTWFTLSFCTAVMWYQAFIRKVPIF